MKFSNVSSKFRKFEEQANSNLVKVEIMVQHDGLNKNDSVFQLENIKRAEHTLKNVPILGYVIKDDEGNKDFDQHNMEAKLVDTDEGFKLKVEYLESPIGVIPSDANVRYEEINERTYLVCDGYVWSKYCADAVEIINGSSEKKVSMEISVDSYSTTEDGYIDIEDYQFEAVTILGDHIESGMHDTVMTRYSAKPDYKEVLADIYKEIYSLGGKEDNMEEVKEETVVEEVVEETKVVSDEVKEEVTEEVEFTEVIEEFALSVDNIRTSINAQLDARTVETEDWWGEKYNRREFYLFDILPSENVAIVEDNLNYYNYYGIPFEIQGDNAVLKFDEKVSYIQEWRPKQEGETVVVFEKTDELKDVIVAKFESKESEMEAIKTSLSNLEEFKSKIDLEELKSEVEVVSGKYELDADVTDLKDKAISKEITMAQFEKELKVLFAEQVLANTKFSKEVKEEPAKVIVASHEEETELYGGLFSKHGLK